MKSICLLLLIAVGAIAVVNGGEFRTDINPAMRYYQGFILSPDLSKADRDYLFEKEWRGQKLPARFGELVSRYDNQFKLVRQAAQATVPCDWGIDMSPGPATLLPHLARCRGSAQAARLRTMWALQNGLQSEARDDLLAALTLGRNASRDGTMIAALVQIAIENIVCSFVAENFHQFSPGILKQISDQFTAAPPRGTLAACIAMEKTSFLVWLVDKIVTLQKQNPGDDARVMAGIREVISGFGSGDEGQGNPAKPSLWEQVNKAARGKSEGVLELLRDEEALYQRMAVIMALPQSEFDTQVKQFSAEVESSANPFVTETIPAVQKARPKEFAVMAHLAMVRAAVEYKLRGEAGLKSVIDPYGQAPFSFARFIFEGVDRGFELKSAYAGRDFPEVLIFVEKDGSPFYVTGPKAGQSASK